MIEGGFSELLTEKQKKNANKISHVFIDLNKPKYGLIGNP